MRCGHKGGRGTTADPRGAGLPRRACCGALYGSRDMPDAASARTIASAPVGTPAQPTLSPRAIAGRALVLIGVLVVVFGIVLPRLVDYDAVRAALAALT